MRHERRSYHYYPSPFRRLAITTLAACLCATALADAEQHPRWEAGLGISALHVPDYRGSQESSWVSLPFPYLIYRSKIFTADREGLRSQLWDSTTAQLTFSVSGSLTTEADDNSLRRGMPELNPTFELGPMLKLKLSGEDFDNGLQLQLPLRAVYDVGDGADIGYVGWVFEPRFLYTTHWRRWRVRLSSGLRYGDEHYHEYYYEVDPSQATALRSAYQADAGYSGWVSGVSVLQRRGRWWYGGFLRYDYLGGASFDDSPLLETDHYGTFGLAVGWVFATSDEMVQLD